LRRHWEMHVSMVEALVQFRQQSWESSVLIRIECEMIGNSERLRSFFTGLVNWGATLY
jgi:hypothetical protein